MAGEIVSLTQQGGEIAHSANRRTAAEEGVIIHRARFEMAFVFPGFSMDSVTGFDDYTTEYARTTTVGEATWEVEGYVDDLAEAVTMGVGCGGDLSYRLYWRDDDESYTAWTRSFALHAITYGGAKIWMLEETDSNGSTLIHTAWTAPRRTAFLNPYASTSGELTFTPLSRADYISWWMTSDDAYFGHVDYTYSDHAAGPLCDWPFSLPPRQTNHHAYRAASETLACGVEIIEQ